MLELIALTCGWFDLPLTFFVGGDDDRKVHAPVPAYLIKHPKGMAVFDTGLGARFFEKLRERSGPFQPDLDPDADIASRLRAIDVDPGAIRWIINSHLHVDHCGGNGYLPNATVVIQSKELAAARADEKGMLYNPLDFDIGQPFLPIDGEYDLFGDGSVMVFPTPGHTPGHQSARVKLPAGDIVLAADCCYLKQNLDALNPSPSDFDREMNLNTLRMLSDMRTRGTRIFFGHDPVFWKDVPQGTPLV